MKARLILEGLSGPKNEQHQQWGGRFFYTPKGPRIELHFFAPYLRGPKVELNPRLVFTFKRALGLSSTLPPPSTSIIYQYYLDKGKTEGKNLSKIA